MSAPFVDEPVGGLGVDSVCKVIRCFQKSQEEVVWSCKIGSGKTDTTPGLWAIDFASTSDKEATNPMKL